MSTTKIRSNYMYKKLVIFLIILTLIGISGSIFLIIKKNNQTNSKVLSITTDKTLKHDLFSSTPYVKYAHQVVPGPITDDTKELMNFFELKQTKLADGTVAVEIRPAIKGYNFQTFIVKPGYSFYFVAMPDAEGDINDQNNLDYLKYDLPILVDDTGYIVNM